MARRQTQKIKSETFNNSFFQSFKCTSLTKSISIDYMTIKPTTDAYVNHLTNEVEWWNPLALAAKANAYDNPRWHEAMNSPDRAGYLEATKVKITTLIRLQAWEIVPQTSDMNVLNSTWAFKYKRYQAGKTKIQSEILL